MQPPISQMLYVIKNFLKMNMKFIAIVALFLVNLHANAQSRYLKFYIKQQKESSKIIGTSIQSPLLTLEEKEVTFENYRGQFLVIDFWFTKCFPCFREFPHMDSVKQIFKNHSELAFINICSRSSIEDWKKVVSERNISGIHLFDNNPFIPNRKLIGAPKSKGVGIIHDQMYLNGYPTYGFIDSTGKILGATSVKPSDKLLFAYYIEGVLKGQNIDESLRKFKIEINSKQPSKEFLQFVMNRFNVDEAGAEALIEPYRKWL